MVVGNIGFEKKMDYTVIGEAVNTVFRMQGLVKSILDGILISETTLRSVRSNLRVTPFDLPGEEVRRDFGQLALFRLDGGDPEAGLVRTGRPSPSSDAPEAPRDHLPSAGHA